MQSIIQKFILFFLVMTALALVGVFLLSLFGRQIIREVTQEVAIDEEAAQFGIAVGEMPPPFQLSDTEGGSTALVDFLGRPLVLTFWTTWNSMAADQIAIFDMYLTEHDRGLFEIVTVNNQEDKSVVSNFIQRGGYRVQVLLDEDGAIGELYEARSLPLTYFIDKEGVVRDVFVGVLSGEMLEQKIETIIR